jgi:hypothetical protein
MLAKCANPSCTALFHYLHEGRLFRLEADPELIPFVDAYASGLSSKVEYFWLCNRCAESLALRLGQDGKVVTVPHPGGHWSNAEDLAIISRDKNMLLRSVTVGRRIIDGH